MSVGNEVLSSLCARCPWPIVEPEHEPGAPRDSVCHQH